MEMKYYQISQKEKELITDKLKSMLASFSDVAFVYLHGSFLNASGFRDIDIAFYMQEAPVSALQKELQLESLFGSSMPYPIDIKILNNAPVSFAYNVLKSGLPVFVTDEDVRVDFVEHTLNNYFDFAPFRKLYLKETLGVEV